MINWLMPNVMMALRAARRQRARHDKAVYLHAIRRLFAPTEMGNAIIGFIYWRLWRSGIVLG